MNLILSKNKYKNLLVILVTLNKSKKNRLFYWTLNNSKKSWLFCWLRTSQKKLIILLILNNTVRPALVTYPSLCSTCMTYRTLCHVIGHQLLPTHPFTASATDLRERFLLSGISYLTLLPAFFKASQGAGSWTSKLAGLHADLQNIVPAQLFVWTTAIHKSFIWGRFLLRVRAGLLGNINLFRNVSFEMFASHEIWTLFIDRQTW